MLLATKATECVDAARELLPFLRDDSILVSLQNGICEQALAEIVGRERVMGCVVGWGATMHGPGELEVTSDGEFVIGNIDGRPDHRLQLAHGDAEYGNAYPDFRQYHGRAIFQIDYQFLHQLAWRDNRSHLGKNASREKGQEHIH